MAAPIHGKSKDELVSDDRRELRRFRRYRRVAVAGLAVLLVVSVIASFVALGQRNGARRQTANAQARELAALSLVEDDPDRALVLAVEAEFVTDDPVAEARSAFAAALQRQARLFATAAGPAWSDHTANVSGLAWAPDGDELVSVSLNGTALIWDADRGEVTAELGTGSLPDPVFLSADWSPTATSLRWAPKMGQWWCSIASEPNRFRCSTQWTVRCPAFAGRLMANGWPLVTRSVRFTCGIEAPGPIRLSTQGPQTSRPLGTATIWPGLRMALVLCHPGRRTKLV